MDIGSHQRGDLAMGKTKANNFDELGLKIAEKAKRESREEELQLLQLDVDESVKENALEAIRVEQDYRKILDSEIQRYKDRLS